MQMAVKKPVPPHFGPCGINAERHNGKKQIDDPYAKILAAGTGKFEWITRPILVLDGGVRYRKRSVRRTGVRGNAPGRGCVIQRVHRLYPFCFALSGSIDRCVCPAGFFRKLPLRIQAPETAYSSAIRQRRTLPSSTSMSSCFSHGTRS